MNVIFNGSNILFDGTQVAMDTDCCCIVPCEDMPEYICFVFNNGMCQARGRLRKNTADSYDSADCLWGLQGWGSLEAWPPELEDYYPLVYQKDNRWYAKFVDASDLNPKHEADSGPGSVTVTAGQIGSYWKLWASTSSYAEGACNVDCDGCRNGTYDDYPASVSLTFSGLCRGSNETVPYCCITPRTVVATLDNCYDLSGTGWRLKYSWNTLSATEGGYDYYEYAYADFYYGGTGNSKVNIELCGYRVTEGDPLTFYNKTGSCFRADDGGTSTNNSIYFTPGTCSGICDNRTIDADPNTSTPTYCWTSAGCGTCAISFVWS